MFEFIIGSIRVKIIFNSGKIIFCFLLLFIPSLQTITQTYYFDNYSVTQGLAQSKVYAVHQDYKGYVWLGTEAGVSKFDGVSFTNLSIENGLAQGGVRTIFQDSRGNIWFGHNGGGLSRYNGNQYQNLSSGLDILQSDITSILETDGEKMWITSSESGALLIHNPFVENDEISYEQYKGNRLSDRVFYSYKDRKGKIYFMTDMGITTYNANLNDFENYTPPNLPRYFLITRMYEDAEGFYWFGTFNGGLYKYDPHTETIVIFDSLRDGLAHNFISFITGSRDGDVWAGTWGGGITRIRGNSLKTFNTGNGLPDNEIWMITEDLEGNVLIGTNNNGLCIFKGEHFISYRESDGLIYPQVWAILEDSQGKFWLGTEKGISIFDPGKKPLLFDNFDMSKEYFPDKVRFIREDGKNNIWIGTDGFGIRYYNPSTLRFYNPTLELINMNLFPRGQEIVTALEIDRDDNLWFGTTDGLAYYETSVKRGQRLTQGDGLAGNEISALLIDSRGIIWVGSRGRGLTKIVDSLITRVELNEVFTARCMVEDSEGNIWIGTESQGVLAYNGDRIIGSFREKTGLLADYITSLAVDHNDNIYIGTNRGLNKFVRSENKIYTYTQKNGFTGIEAKSNAAFTDSQGRVWFGSVEGVMVYDPSLTRIYYPEPLTLLTGFMVNYMEREMEHGLKLGYREKAIVFNYKSICLTNQEAVRYRTKLEGSDPEWSPVTTRTEAIYSALPPGRYAFKVIASNSEGVWNSEPVSFSFKINAPWYRRWFSIFGFIIAGILIIALYIKNRERKLRLEKKILEEKVAERTYEISVKNEELAVKNKDITDSIRYAKRLQEAILPFAGHFENTFVFFKPKDIVSGDFYWFMTKNGKELIAAVDCTGHGVPGAFMSLIGHNSLNKIVNELGVTRPSAILDLLNVEVYNALHQREEVSETVRDGMDLSLISYSRSDSVVEYAGAYNSLYLVSNGELKEIKASKFAIGYSLRDADQGFENHRIRIQNGDLVYLFSDGYADQFGGGSGKKFMSRNLRDLLLDIHLKPVEEQRSLLEGAFESWKGEHDQIDDVLIIGRKF